MHLRTAFNTSTIATGPRLFLSALLAVLPLGLPAAAQPFTLMTLGLGSPMQAEAALDPGERMPLPFREIWAYLMAGEERFLPAASPITDLAYFSARISSRGELFGTPDVQRLAGFAARKHLVVAEVSNQALVHFVLAPEYGLRDTLIEDIVAAADPYDGVVIDFELVPSYDAENFRDFLAMLRVGLGARMLTVCVPARTRKLDDAYDYEKLASVTDRIFVMAYDEHWSGSDAGAVASLGWTSKVSAWSVASVERDKLIMGMPFYGRAWGDKNPAGAYKFSSALRVIEEKGILLERDHEGIPFFSFSETVNVVLFFDDAESIWRRARVYCDDGIGGIGFWRLGQEDPAVWSVFRTAP